MRCVTIHVQQQQQQQIHVTTQVAENLQRSSNPIQKPKLCLFHLHYSLSQSYHSGRMDHVKQFKIFSRLGI